MTRLSNLREQVKEILMKHWDPIGIQGIPEAAGEYDGYAGDIAKMVSVKTSTHDLENHLLRIEVASMGLQGDPARARRVAENLARLAFDR